MKKETEDRLVEFLQQQADVDVAGTLKSVVEKLTFHEKEDQDRHLAILSKLGSHDYRLSTLEQDRTILKEARSIHSLRVGRLEHEQEKVEEKLEVTGSYYVEDLKKRNGFWKDNSAKLGFGALGAAVTALIAGFINWLSSLPPIPKK